MILYAIFLSSLFNHQQIPVPVQLRAVNWWVSDRGVLDAGGAIPADTEKVATWMDLIGTVDATQSTDGTRPAYVTATHSLHFDGAINQWLQTNINRPFNLPITLYAIAKKDSASSGFEHIIAHRNTGSANGAIILRQHSPGDFWDGSVHDSIGPRRPVPEPTTTTDTVLLILRAGEGEILNNFTDGVQYDSPAPTLGWASADVPCLFGSLTGSTTAWIGIIYEIGYFNRRLTTAEIDRLERYAVAKYGLAFTP